MPAHHVGEAGAHNDSPAAIGTDALTSPSDLNVVTDVRLAPPAAFTPNGRSCGIVGAPDQDRVLTAALAGHCVEFTREMRVAPDFPSTTWPYPTGVDVMISAFSQGEYFQLFVDLGPTAHVFPDAGVAVPSAATCWFELWGGTNLVPGSRYVSNSCHVQITRSGSYPGDRVEGTFTGVAEMVVGANSLPLTKKLINVTSGRFSVPLVKSP